MQSNQSRGPRETARFHAGAIDAVADDQERLTAAVRAANEDVARLLDADHDDSERAELVQKALREAANGKDDAEALTVLARFSGLPVVRPLADWRNAKPPAPVLWAEGEHGVVWPLVSEGEPGVLTGPGSIGKSGVALHIALAAAETAPREERTPAEVLGLKVRPGPAVLVAYEDSPARLNERLARMGRKCAPPDLHVMDEPGPLRVGDPDRRGETKPGPSWAPLVAACERLKPSLVVLDPAAEVLTDVPASEATAVRALYRELCRLPGDPGVLIIAHDTKAARNEARGGGDPGAGAVAGSSAWFDRARAVAYLRRLDEDRRILEAIKANHGPDGWGLELDADKDDKGRFRQWKLTAALSRAELAEIKAEKANRTKRNGTNATDSAVDML